VQGTVREFAAATGAGRVLPDRRPGRLVRSGGVRGFRAAPVTDRPAGPAGDGRQRPGQRPGQRDHPDDSR